MKDAWREAHIHNTSSNNTDLKHVDSRLMDAIVRTSMQFDLDLGINAGKEDCCNHSRDGGHWAGLAVDINRVGDTRFNQMSDRDKNTWGNWLGGQIASRMPYNSIHIVATPGFAMDRSFADGYPHFGLDAARIRSILTEHHTHVHFSIYAP